MKKTSKDEKNQKSLYLLANARKVNAVFSILATLLILIHGTYDSIWMYLRGKINTLPKVFAISLMIFVVVHMILSIVIAIKGRKLQKNKNGRIYKKQNIKTILQRIFAILIILMLPLHVIGMSNHLSPKILHAIVHPLFFLVVYGHVAISTSKAFITLGVGNAKFIKVVDIIMYIIFIVLFLSSLNGLYWVMYGSWQG